MAEDASQLGTGRRKFVMVLGMKEHPETGELLFPGDVFELDSALILRPSQMGGWLQPEIVDRDNPQNIKWVLACARPVPEEVEETRVLRDEPSQIIGVNISQAEFQRGEDVRAAREARPPDAAIRNTQRRPAKPAARTRTRG